MAKGKDLRGFWKGELAVPLAPLKSKKSIPQKPKAKPAPPKRPRANKRRKHVGKPHPEYKSGRSFYRCREWLELRYAALKNTDGRCQCCGASAADGVQLHVDHVIPRYKDPRLELNINNLQVLCMDCNVGKGAWDQTDWRNHMKSIAS